MVVTAVPIPLSPLGGERVRVRGVSSPRKRRAATAATVLGILAILYGAWIPAKAALAQILLRAAWQRTLHGASDARPWPWADTRPVARIVIDRTGSDFIVLEGANGRALAFAPAHLERTALPGDPGNCVISAHRDTHFAALRNVVSGDVVRLQQSDGRWLTYRVAAQRVVDKHEMWVTRNDGVAALTLVTCYPFDAIVPGGPERYVIQAMR
jgi:sortase A